MPKLVLMRHAKSSHADRELSDHDRPLNDRGRRDAPAIARYLNEIGLSVDLVLASTALRVQETLGLIRPIFDYEQQKDLGNLYLATTDDLKQALLEHSRGCEAVMVVGHNPGLSELASQLALGFVEMPTAAVVVFECQAEDWATAFRSGIWKCTTEVRPRELAE